MADSLGPSFRRLVSASALSNLADGVFQVALPLLALRLTDSPALVSGVVLASRLPWLLFALQAGALADRLDRKRTMLRVDTARGILIGILGVLVVLGREQLWVLYVLGFLLGIGETLFDTAAQSVLPSVVDKASLDRANGRLQAVEITTNQFIGPPVGGFLAGVAISTAFLGSAACYVVAPLVLAGMRGSFRPERVGPARPMRHDIAEGARWLLHHRVLRTCALLVGTMNLMETAMIAVLPIYAIEGPLHLSEAGYGLVLTCFAVGSVLGSLVVERMVGRLGRARALMVAVASFASMPAALLTRSIPVIAVVWVVSAFLSISWNVITVSLRQRIVPDHLLGRINAAYRLLAWGTMPFGALLGGAIAQVWSEATVFVVSTVVLLGCVAWTATIRDAEIDGAEQAAIQVTV